MSQVLTPQLMQEKRIEGKKRKRERPKPQIGIDHGIILKEVLHKYFKALILVRSLNTLGYTKFQRNKKFSHIRYICFDFFKLIYNSFFE